MSCCFTMADTQVNYHNYKKAKAADASTHLLKDKDPPKKEVMASVSGFSNQDAAFQATVGANRGVVGAKKS